MRIFNRKTRWIVLGSYGFSTEDYIVFVRGNKDNGLLEFKVKKIQPLTIYTNRIIPNDLIDVRKQWDLIIALTNKAPTQ